MAKFTPGPLAGAISGSIGGTTFSHNRWGPYMRRRAIPVTSTTQDALAAKARLTSQSQAWQTRTSQEKAAWNTWATVNPITGPLGNAQVLTGHTCYIMLNTRLIQAGQATITIPPTIPTPPPLTSLTLSADIGVGTFDVTFEATPLGAANMLRIRAALLHSQAIEYVQNLLRVIGFSAVAQASPFDIETLVTAKFGSPQVDDKLVVLVDVVASTNGQISAPLRDSALVVSTTP